MPRRSISRELARGPITKSSILYEDQWLVVVDKPSGVLSHPNPGGRGPAAFEGRYDFKERRFHPPQGAPVWLIHRLDQETSGALLAARDPETARKCRALFEEGKIRKIYLAVVGGRPVPPAGSWRDHLVKKTVHGGVRSMVLKGRSPNAELKYRITTRDAPRSVFHISFAPARPRADGHFVRSCETSPRWALRPLPQDLATAGAAHSLSLLEIELLTGRTHQIRVQAAWRNHPILGDRIYGDFALNRRFKIRRLCLHAWKLEFSHPVTGAPLRLEAPLLENGVKIF